MKCQQCGEPLKPGNKYCTSCGAPVPEQPAEPGQPQQAAQPPEGAGVPSTAPPTPVPPPTGPSTVGGPAGVPGGGGGRGSGFKGFLKSPLGIVVISVVALLVIGGIVLGVILGLNAASRNKAKADAEKYSQSANQKVSSAADALEDLAGDLQEIDFTNPEAAQSDIEDLEDQMEEAGEDLDAALDDLAKIDTGKLDSWWGKYKAALVEACNEGKEGIKDLQKLMSSFQSVGEFSAAVNTGVDLFDQFIQTLNSALQEQASSRYSEAKGIAQTALDYAQQAGQQFDQAKNLAPEADLDKFTSNVAIAIEIVSIFQNACDAAAMGDIAKHNQLIDQFNAKKDGIVLDMTFDVEAQFGASVNKLMESMEEHFDKAEKSFEEAQELYGKNT